MAKVAKTIPRRLKPTLGWVGYGPAKAGPFQNCEFFCTLVKRCPFKTASFLHPGKAVPLQNCEFFRTLGKAGPFLNFARAECFPQRLERPESRRRGPFRCGPFGSGRLRNRQRIWKVSTVECVCPP